MARHAVLVISFMVLSLLLFFPNPQNVDGKIQSATLSIGTAFEWSYSHRSIDGSSTRSGTMSSTVSETQWRGFDAFIFEGSLTGTYSTPSGSGTESGTWIEYYRKVDLAFMDHFEEIDLVFGINTVTNSTNIDHSPPLRWIEFPLSVESPKSMWDQTGVKTTTAWDRIVNDDDDTRESGSSQGTEDYTWVCATTQSITVGAGTFDTYRIVEWVEDHPDNQRTEYHYSEEVGFWVQKDVWLDDDQGDPVKVRHFELKKLSRNLPPYISGSPQITMDEDTQDSSLDLSSIFVDPDDDPLSFSVVSSGPLTAEVLADNRLSITPPENAFGSFNVTVSASDGVNDPVHLVIPVTVISVDDPPVLFNPYMGPLSGDETTTFTMSIDLTDIDSLEPSTAVVHVGSEFFDLARTSGDNVTGMTLSWSGTLPSGDHTHYFLVDGVRHPTSGDITGPTVLPAKVPFLKDGGVDIEVGGLSTEFEFTVTWVGQNGEYPDDVHVIIDGMRSEMDRQYGNPKTGTVYAAQLILGEGEHSYHFEAKLGDDIFRHPESNELIGPDVYQPEITGTGHYRLGEAMVGVRYGFYANYRYVIDTYPESIHLIINGDRHEFVRYSGDPISGMNYSMEITLSEGEYRITVEALCDGKTLAEDEYTLMVKRSDGDPPQNDGESDPKVNALTIVIIASIIIIAIISAAAILFLLNRKKVTEVPDTVEMEMDS
ncbi:MAG: Ig-like domain-containing protein [Candidatus Thermoplasmatota archaeon]|nr:Ig-like domain-containing protein [Candidatus Thermoplasmatota archaeon]